MVNVNNTESELMHPNVLAQKFCALQNFQNALEQLILQGATADPTDLATARDNIARLEGIIAIQKKLYGGIEGVVLAMQQESVWQDTYMSIFYPPSK